jgi:hypothetical protein
MLVGRYLPDDDMFLAVRWLGCLVLAAFARSFAVALVADIAGLVVELAAD